MLNEKSKKWILFIISFIVLRLVLYGVFEVMIFVEKRDGMVLWDPVHLLLEPVDFSPWIFAATYTSFLLCIVVALSESIGRLTYAFFIYSAIMVLRSLAMLSFPLDPPIGIIPLIDPVVNFFNPEQFVATKDLFFSGHCASMFFLYLTARKTWLKWFMAFVNIFVIIALSWQRVHYTIDIIVGIMVAYGMVKLFDYIFEKYGLFLETEKQEKRIPQHQNYG